MSTPEEFDVGITMEAEEGKGLEIEGEIGIGIEEEVVALTRGEVEV